MKRFVLIPETLYQQTSKIDMRDVLQTLRAKLIHQIQNGDKSQMNRNSPSVPHLPDHGRE